MLPIYKYSEIDENVKKKLMKRAQADIDEIYQDVKNWINLIRAEGDQGILKYIQKYDDPDFKLENLKVNEADFVEAYKNVPKETVEIIQKQISISKKFHEAHMDKIVKKWEIETVPGVITGTKVAPIESAGLYVPAGKAPLPTVAQILTVAAKTAGVKRAVVCFPPTGKHYEILIAAKEAGVDEVYRVGGIAAIAALAYGTESIKSVEKISGPGSPYVQAAKLQVFGQIGIDMLAGPSEALIMADETANPAFVAADVLARCEHGPDSAGVVVTDSSELAGQIKVEVEKQFQNIDRQEFAKNSLENGYSAIIVVDSRVEMIDFANDYAAEHLEIQMKDALSVADKITNAGSIFIGDYAPVAVGDYASGTNHSLPTARAVKFSSPVGVETFLKTNEYQILTKEGLQNLEPIVSTITKVEGLDAHRKSVQIRLSSSF